MIDCECPDCGAQFQSAPAGGHRLLCGDALREDCYRALLGGEPANLVFTSPPYASQRKYDEASGFRPVRPDDYVVWYAPAAACIKAVLAGDGSYFLNIKEHCEDGQRHLYVKDLTIAHVRQWGWRFVDEFCWRDVKNGFPGKWPDRFKDAWEPVFHFSAKSKIKFHPSANGTKSEDAFSYVKGSDMTLGMTGYVEKHRGQRQSGQALPSNVIEIGAGGMDGHSAAFPVDLPAWFVRAFSDPGDLVLDPFIGSGTTLIAAEREGRRAAGIEVSPAYCDVVVMRWEQYTGRRAVLDGDGRTFAALREERDAA